MTQRMIHPRELDRLLRYPNGRCTRLARAGKIPHIVLPDGEIRFDPNVIDEWLAACAEVETQAAHPA